MKDRKDSSVILLFLLWEAILYFTFLALDWSNTGGMTSNVMKYAAILSCLIYTLYLSVKTKKKTTAILACALFFTAISDSILLFTDYFIAGIIFFIIVQSFHFYRIALIKQLTVQQFIKRIVLRVLIAVLFSVFFFLQDNFLLVGSIYAANLAGNFVEAVSGYKKYRTTSFALLSIGFFLFILCDINVLLYNLPEYSNAFSAIVIWFFYLPSQILLLLSETVRFDDKYIDS